MSNHRFNLPLAVLLLTGVSVMSLSAKDPSDNATNHSSLLSDLDPTSQLLEQVEGERRVKSGKIQAEVEEALNRTRKTMGGDSAGAVQSLKAVLDNVVR